MGTIPLSELKSNQDIKILMGVPSGVTATATTGGTLTSGTYYYRVTAIDLDGGETTASSEVSATVDGVTTNAITISWTTVAGAVKYRVYGRATGAQDQYWETTSTSYTDTGTAGTSGSVPTLNAAYTVNIGSNLKSTEDEFYLVDSDFQIKYNKKSHKIGFYEDPTYYRYNCWATRFYANWQGTTHLIVDMDQHGGASNGGGITTDGTMYLYAGSTGWSPVTAFKMVGPTTTDGILSIYSGSNLTHVFKGDGNILIGIGSSPTSGTNGIILADGTALSGLPADTAGLYADDPTASGTVELFGIDEVGNTTQLTPHASKWPDNLAVSSKYPQVHVDWNIYLDTDGDGYIERRYIALGRLAELVEELAHKEGLLAKDEKIIVYEPIMIPVKDWDERQKEIEKEIENRI